MVSVSTNDPYRVEVVGQLEINKTVVGVVQQASRQLMFTLALRADTAKRTQDNQNTGFRIAGIVNMKILEEQAGGLALVAGATRGAGRGIAAALGEAGATVYCSGRSSRTHGLRSDYDRPF